MIYALVEATGAVLSTACWEPATMSVGANFRMLYTFAWLLGTLGVRKTALFGAVLFKLEAKRHRHAPTAHHLQLLGTSPDHQSKGLGATAMMAGIRRATSAGVPCYRESSTPKNVPFDTRHGCKIVEEYYPGEAAGAGGVGAGVGYEAVAGIGSGVGAVGGSGGGAVGGDAGGAGVGGAPSAHSCRSLPSLALRHGASTTPLSSGTMPLPSRGAAGEGTDAMRRACAPSGS